MTIRTVGRWATFAFGVLIASTLTGCVSSAHFLDANVKDVETTQLHKTDPLHPVQVLFNFQTKGVDNTRATDVFKSRVLDQVAASGVFSKVSDQPVDGSALLTIKVNNVPLDDDAVSKGFATGLTLGLAGSVVSDGYICTANYLAPGSSVPITKEFHHAIHTTIGNHAPPDNTVVMPSIDAAATTMLHQSVSHLLQEVTTDANFK